MLRPPRIWVVSGDHVFASVIQGSFGVYMGNAGKKDRVVESRDCIET